ncbi:unnamed protein product, partial [Staurois parvus]
MSSSETPQPLLEQLQCLAQRVNVQQAFQEQIMQCLQELSSQLNQLQVVSTSSPSVSAPVLVPAAPTPAVPLVEHSHSKLQLPPPPCFSGDSKACRGFIKQCSIHFELAAHHFPTDRSKVAYMISLLSGEALAWAL